MIEMSICDISGVLLVQFDEGKVPTPDGMTLTPNKVNTFKATKPPLRKKKNKKK